MTEPAGRESVLREFVRHRSSLFAFILSVVRRFDAAEEVLQEVAVVVLDQWQEFRPGTNFQAWASRIARNKIFNMNRLSRREILLSPEAIAAVEEVTSADSRAGWLEAVQKCSDALEPRARVLVALRYHDGLDGQEIGKRLKMSVTAVHMALSRARAAVGRCVEASLSESEATP